MFENSKLSKEVLNNQLVVSYEDKDVFKKGTDIPAKTLKAVEDYRSSYLEKATEFISKYAESELKKDKKIEKVVAQLPFSTSGRGFVTINVDRKKTFPGVNGAPATTKSKISVVVKDPYIKVSKSYVKNLEEGLTKTLLS